jgi:hypothetical protein
MTTHTQQQRNHSSKPGMTALHQLGHVSFVNAATVIVIMEEQLLRSVSLYLIF